jgi:lipoprotein-anchoring transpeptidase ErfK/SrfK
MRLLPQLARSATDIRIDISTQQLTLIERGLVARQYPVSTAAKGHGCEAGSYRTPIGLHRIILKVGEGQPLGAVFVSRRPTGEVFSSSLREASRERDWILTRILWLDGLEPGRNRGGNVDTLRRHIYIHGTPDEGMNDPPSSHGCIRMFNSDIMDLFARVPAGTTVLIEANADHKENESEV